MSKTLGKVLTVAAVVVSVAAAAVTAGASLGISAGLLAGIGAGLSVASLINNEALAAKARGQLQARQASVTSLQLGEVAREAIFGTALTGGSLVDAFNYGGAQGTDWEVLVIALADHECDSLVGFYVNDAYVPFTGDGTVGGYNGQLQVYWRPGTATQTVPAVLTSYGPGWTANDRGAGVCWVTVCYKADKADAKNPVWTAGRPSFAWLLRGKKCYQARLDSSVGGAGAHRWSDPSTWSWTDNLIDCRYNWVRGVYACNQVEQPGMLLVGRGLSAIEAPPTNVFAPANVCDEVVALDAGGSEKRYRANGVIRADETYIDVEEHFAAACGGIIYQPEGAVEIEPGQAKAAVFFFSDDDLITGSVVEFSDDLPETDAGWVNTVVPRYVEPSQKYAEHAAPIRRVAADVVADGGAREQALSLALVTSSTQAGRVGEIARRLGRLLRRGKVTLGPRYAEVEEGDWGVWTSPRYLGGASVMFRVEAFALDAKWQNTLVLREISAACYARDADAAANTVALQQSPPSIGAPGAGAWALSAGTLAAGGDSVPALVITGAADNDFAELVRFEYLPAAGVLDPATATGWREDGTAGPDVRRREIGSVASSTSYYAAVSYIVGRVPGPRLIVGPVTTGGMSSAQAAAAQQASIDAQAMADAAAANAADALDEIDRIQSDGWLTAGEKPDVIRRWTDAFNERSPIITQALGLGLPNTAGSAVSNYGAAYDALGAYLNSLSPAWNDTSADTAVTGSTFRDRWNGYYFARQQLLNAIAAEAATRATWGGTSGKPANVGALTGSESIDNALVPVGQNVLFNADFARGTENFGFANSSFGDQGINLPNWWGARQVVWAHAGGFPPADTIISDWTHRGSWLPGGSLDQLRKYSLSVQPGDRVGVAARVACHRSRATIYALFFNVDGALIYAPADNNGWVLNGSDGGNNLGLMSMVLDAPTGAAFAMVMVRWWGTDQQDPYIFISEPWLGKLAPGQTTVPPWSGGKQDPLGDETKAQPIVKRLHPVTGRVIDPLLYNTQSILNIDNTTNLVPEYEVGVSYVTVHLPAHRRVVTGPAGPLTLNYGAISGAVPFDSFWVAYIDDPELTGIASPTGGFSDNVNDLLYPARYQVAVGYAPGSNGIGGGFGYDSGGGLGSTGGSGPGGGIYTDQPAPEQQ